MEKGILMSFANLVRRRSRAGAKFCGKREWPGPSEPRRPKMPVTAEIQSVDDKSAVSLTTQAYETLRQDILAGVLPPGKKLRIEELKESYGIGATAIREALSMLTSDLLVQRVDHRGFRVAPLSQAGFDELLRTRCWLEERALRESIRCGDVRWEEGVILSHYRLSRSSRVESSDRFLAHD